MFFLAHELKMYVWYRGVVAGHKGRREAAGK